MSQLQLKNDSSINRNAHKARLLFRYVGFDTGSDKAPSGIAGVFNMDQGTKVK